MAENYSLHNLILNIATLGARNGKISKDEFMEQIRILPKKNLWKKYLLFLISSTQKMMEL